MTDTDAIWVSSDVASDEASYVLTVHFGPDLSHALTSAEAVDYAATVLRAGGAAEYDAAVITQLTSKLGIDERSAAEVLTGMRRDHGQQTWTAGPLMLAPGVSAVTRKPFLRCSAGPREWQWDPADVQQHARQVLECAAAVDYDTAYRRYLVEELGIEPVRALAVVEDIANYR